VTLRERPAKNWLMVLGISPTAPLDAGAAGAGAYQVRPSEAMRPAAEASA
jgi:hypothetical protein